MSIWASHEDIGWDEPGFRGDALPGDVRTYVHSGHYPTTDDKPASVGTSSIPSYCIPGHADELDDGSGPWLRLSVSIWHDEFRRPMIADGATVVLDVEAARSLAADLLEWADQEHVTPREET